VRDDQRAGVIQVGADAGVQFVELALAEQATLQDLGSQRFHQIRVDRATRMADRVGICSYRDPDVHEPGGTKHFGQPAAQMDVRAVLRPDGEEASRSWKP